jgi:hypothetical protein
MASAQHPIGDGVTTSAEREELIDAFLRDLARVAVDALIADPDAMNKIAAQSREEPGRRKGRNDAEHTPFPAST